MIYLTDEIGEMLTENCAKVSQWMTENKFNLNADKTHLLTVGTSQRVAGLPHPVQVQMDGLQLEEGSKKYEALLGVNIQHNLKWGRTVEGLATKLKKRLAGLNKLRAVVPSISHIEDRCSIYVQQCPCLLPPALWRL